MYHRMEKNNPEICRATHSVNMPVAAEDALMTKMYLSRPIARNNFQNAHSLFLVINEQELQNLKGEVGYEGIFIVFNVVNRARQQNKHSSPSSDTRFELLQTR